MEPMAPFDQPLVGADRGGLFAYDKGRPPAPAETGRGVADYEGVDVGKSICSELNCERPVSARGWCVTHYHRRYRAGLIPAQLPDPTHHRLSGVDVDARTGICSVCGPVAIRVRGKGGGKRGYECMEKRKTDRRKRNQARKAPAMRRKYTYNIPEATQTALLDVQGGACAVCGGPPERLDHDHECCPGKGSCGECARGFLCHRCNIGLSWFMDDPERLDMAADYLRDPPIKAVRRAVGRPAA